MEQADSNVFFLHKWLFLQCGSENERDKWINKILKVKNVSNCNAKLTQLSKRNRHSVTLIN